MLDALISIAVPLVVDSIWQEIIVAGIAAKLKEEIVRRKVTDAVSESLQEAFGVVPGFDADIGRDLLIDYFRSPLVSKELKKVVSLWETPDINLLCEEWSKKFASISRGNIELLLSIFLERLKKKIREISELQDTVYKKESLESFSHLSSGIKIIQSQLVQISEAQTLPIDNISKEELVWQTKLDTYRDLIRKGFPNAALPRLQEIENELEGKNLSNQIRSRVQGLLGFCHYLLGNNTKAIKRFQDALVLNPEDPKVLANAALAALLADKFEEAIEYATRALQNGGEDTAARAIRTDALAIQRNFKDLDDLVDEKALGNTDYVRGLAHIFFRAKNFDLAEKYYRICLVQNPADFHSLLGLTALLLHPTRRQRYIPISQANETRGLIESAINIARAGDNQDLISQALAARSGFLMAMNDLQGARQDCNDVLKDFPNHVIALHNRGIIALLEGDFELSIKCFSSLPKSYVAEEGVFLPLAEALIANKKPEEAIALFQELSTRGEFADQALEKAIYAKALIRLNKADEAQKLKEELLSQEGNTEAFIAASQIADLQGNFSEAVEILERANQTIKEGDAKQETLRLQLALIHFFHRDFETSIRWFDILRREFLADIDLAQMYISAQYAIKKYGDTYKALQDARSLGVGNTSFLELESWLAEYFGDIRLALDLQKQLVTIKPDELNHKVQLARLEFRNEHQAEALLILNSIRIDSLQNPRDLMLVAEMFSYLGENQSSLQIAFKAWHIGHDLPEIHLAYISLFLRLDDELGDLLNPNVIQADTAVLVESGDTKRWIKLLAIIKPTNEWEFSLDSDTAKLLVGHTTGDTVEFKSTSIEQLQYTIQKVQSIYVRAFQESFDEFGTRFPGHPGFHKMEIQDGNIAKLLVPLVQRSNYVEEVYRLYEQGQLPLGLFASLIGVSPVDLLMTLQVVKDQRVYASNGNESDQQQQAKAIVDSEAITLDISGLITLSYLDLLQALHTRFNHIYISQVLLDELEVLMVERRFQIKKGRSYLGFHDGRPFYEETSPEVLERNINYLAGLRQYLSENCEVVPVPPDLAGKISLPSDIADKMGRLSLATILIARHTNTPLYADDAVLRKLAGDMLGVGGFWSQIVLKNLAEKGIISEEEYAQNIAELSKCNYFFVSVNSPIIISVITKAVFATNERVAAILKGLRGPDADENKSINIAGEVLKNVWLSAAMPEQKRMILDAILRSLFSGRSAPVVKQKLLRVLQSLLIVAPLQLYQLHREIELASRVLGNIT